MGELVRSADMVYLQVLIPVEAAESFADEMCRTDLMMFTDLNENVQMFQRDYIKDITRINETERALKNIQGFFTEYGALTAEDLELDPEEINVAPRSNELNLFDLADSIQKFYVDLAQQVVSSRSLQMQVEKLNDQLKVLESLDRFLADAPDFHPGQYDTGMNAPLVGQTGSRDGQEVGFKYLAGVCPLVKVMALRKQIFHITRGNRYFRSETLEDESSTGKKAAFVVFFIGDYARQMIKKFCEWMDVEIFLDSSDEVNKDDLAGSVERRIAEHENLLRETNSELKRTMLNARADVCVWNIQLKQEMAIRVLLNKFKLRKNTSILRAEGWVPRQKQEQVKQALKRAQSGTKAVGTVEEVKGKGVKPTYFEMNKFTAAFQLLIDTYGVPRNGEFNPTVPSIVTFPFLFAMMYGDIFHGSFLFLGGCWLVWNEVANAKSKNEFLSGMHMGRYVILLMGLFAIYNGLIYNDCTSISINGFNGQQWQTVEVEGKEGTYIVEHGKATGVYAFGVDPVWAISSQQLSYMNSLKMKMSVLVGITQMTFGLFLKLSNHLHEGDWLSIVGEFIPQLIFMLVFFGYMQFIIIYKWCTDWTGRYSPSLITVLVDMVLKPGSIVEDENMLYGEAYKGIQGSVQSIFLLLMFISIPWMLLMKPLVLRSRMNAAANHGHGDEQQLMADHEDGGHAGGHHGDSFSEIMIEQIIHTIEYVLGTISNTASYLRLWALSLAHAQLAEVFYGKTILAGMQSGNGAMTFVTCAMFFAFTVAVLLMMDVLECFLHALRLHWVEFQNKFYYADGVAFEPFSYSSFCTE
jgi:V-type H+-transporting ATPase subunit a